MNGNLLRGLDFSAYRALDGLSITSLKELRRSPMAFRYRMDTPRTGAALSLGTAAHCAILEPRRFAEDYITWDQRTESGTCSPRRGKAWDEFVSRNIGKTILNEEEWAKVLGMANAVGEYEPAMRYLQSGEPEVSMAWTDVSTGRACRGRIDWLTEINGEDVIVGLKTARSSEPRAFANDAVRLGYHLQWAFYADGFAAITGRLAKVVEIVVESSAPFEPAVYVIPPIILEAGFQEYNALIKRLGACEESGIWGPALDAEVELSYPLWALGSDDDPATMGLDFVDAE